MFPPIPEYVPTVISKKLLLLEDDRHFSTFLSEFLSTHGYAVTTVPNGADGVREILNSDFDVIICDMLMPKLPGDMFYLAVKRSKPHLCPRFIFITGNFASARVSEFIKQVNGVLLEKPFQVADLLRVLKRVESIAQPGPQN